MTYYGIVEHIHSRLPRLILLCTDVERIGTYLIRLTAKYGNRFQIKELDEITSIEITPLIMSIFTEDTQYVLDFKDTKYPVPAVSFETHMDGILQ